MKNILPDWGPYSKKYAGISKVISDRKTGIRFDTVVHPTLANSGTPLPNPIFPSAFHPWEASEDLSYYSYRHDLEWKDKVYADVSFSKMDENHTLIRTAIVNHTELAQNCLVNYFHGLEYPSRRRNVLAGDEAAFVISGIDYEEFHYALPRPWDHLNADGRKKGELGDDCFIGGKAIGDRMEYPQSQALGFLPFGASAGDSVSYQIPANTYQKHMVIAYRTSDEKAAEFVLYWNGVKMGSIIFPASKQVCLLQVPLFRQIFHSAENNAHKTGVLTLEGLGQGGLELNCLIFTDVPDKLQIQEKPYVYKPARTETAPLEWCLKYEDVEEEFYFRTIQSVPRIREIETGCLEDALLNRLSNWYPTCDQVTRPYGGAFSQKHSDDGHYENFIVHSIFVPAGETHIEYAVIGSGSMQEPDPKTCEMIYEAARAAMSPLSYKGAGSTYEFSNRLLRTALLTNIVYPINRHGEYIQHHTPGRRWDSLYTWDSGFIGLGLLECDPALAERMLDLYLSEEDNEDFAFLFHGSPVPVQIYLYQELVKRSTEPLKYASYYPRARRYYLFLTGKTEGSSTDKFNSGLTTTYDYFYNTSGIDDLPAQNVTHERRLEQCVAPAICSSQVVRCAKILKQLAGVFGYEDDIAGYEEDIERISNALQNYSWDEECGYYSYVLHDEDKNPCGFLRSESGENMNKGMDGIYPLIAGICNSDQRARLLGHLMSDKEMFSWVGISAVDMSAGYFTSNGYWNGNVWFAHQWFIWKTMLDLGESDFAYEIATRALKSWKQEVEHSYNTFEMLNIATGRGGWYHQFGGLSAPINIWTAAYFKPGIITSGFDMHIQEKDYSEEGKRMSFRFIRENKETDSVIIVSMPDIHKQGQYKVICDQGEVTCLERVSGTLELRIPQSWSQGRIRIE